MSAYNISYTNQSTYTTGAELPSSALLQLPNQLANSGTMTIAEQPLPHGEMVILGRSSSTNGVTINNLANSILRLNAFTLNMAGTFLNSGFCS